MKKFLVVIKDNLEYKNFVEYFQLLKNKDYDIYITSPVENDKRFIKDINKLDKKIKILNIWNEDKITFADKSKYWIKRQFFYLENSLNSESCFQKFWIHLGFSENSILSGRFRNVHKILNKLFNLVLPRFVYNAIYNMKYNSKLLDVNKNYSFDYIVFMRPDSAINILFYNSFKNAKNKVITFIRNYDTPALKGKFTVPSDITLTSLCNVKTLINNLHPKKDINKLFFIKKQRSIKSTSDKILYCTSHPKFAPQENEIVNTLYNKLSIKDKKKFYIRLHPSDNKNRYNIPEEYFTKTDKEFCTYSDKKERIHKFHNLESIKLYNEQLSQVKTLMTISSTIVADAYENGVNDLVFLQIEEIDKYKFVYRREHILLLINTFNIKIIRNLYEY